MTDGKMFIPDESGKPVKYIVHMGMIINEKTGEQYGTIKPPTEGPDGQLTGGEVTINGFPPKKQRLEDMTCTVFDLQRQGESGIASRSIQGVSRGPREYQADGKPKPEIGGMLNIGSGL